jgi:hypothetical protein
MIRRFEILIAVVTVFLTAGAWAEPEARTLTPSQLQEDLTRLRAVLEGGHAGLYRYTEKSEIDARFDDIEQLIDKPMSEIDFFRALHPLIDSIRDGHTNIRPRREYRGKILENHGCFPFDIFYVDGHAFIEANYSDNTDIPLGAEVLSINGMSSDVFTEILLRTVGTDGDITTSKYARLNELFWLRFAENIDLSEVFELELAVPVGGEVRRYEVDGVPAQVILDEMRAKEDRSGLLFLSFEDDKDIAIMRIVLFTDLKTSEFFESSFRTLKDRGIRNLIIDIRGNSGGYDIFNTDLIQYLSSRPFRFYDRFSSRLLDETLFEKSSFDRDDFFYVPEILSMSEAERQDFVNERSLIELIESYRARNPAAGIHYPHSDYFFDGDVYLLFDGGSGSSGGEVPALMHHLGIGTLIGEEANGAYEGVTAGIRAPVVLPNSGIRFGIPLIAYHNAVMSDLFEARGAPPDFQISQSLEDKINGIDTVMEFTKALIERRNPSPGLRNNEEAAGSPHLLE